MTESMERVGVSRRSFLGGVGVTVGGLVVASGPVFWQQAARAATVTAEQVHLTFGEDPTREVAVSWVTPTSVSNPKVMIGTAAGGFGRTIEAETRTYTDSNNGIVTIAQHASIDGGLVHLVIGTGGTKGHDDVYLSDTAGEQEETINVSGTATETEVAPWSAVTDPNTTYPWGIGVFDVDPGRFPGDKTTMTFTYYHTPAATASAPYPTAIEYDTFTATRTRSDGFGFRQRSAK